MTTPRIRTDLQATPTEEGGIKYVDVNDPRSGARMRMYDFEWLIAERMDGRRGYDEVASWARERLGIQPTASDLEDYARRLSELGFFELDAETVRGGNGAGTHAPSDDDESDIPDITAEAPPIAATAVPVPAPEREPSGREVIPLEKLKMPGNSAAGAIATAPTTAMPAVREESEPLPPAPARAVNAPTAPVREEHATTGSIGSRPTAAATAPPAKSSSSALSILGLLIVVVLALGVAVWFKYLGGTTTKVTTVVATPREVVRLYDGSATVRRSDGQTLSFGEAGKVSDIVAQGTEAKAGMPLATLDSYAKIEKDLADVKDRAGYYEKQLAAAKQRGDENAAKAAEAKVAEKKKLMSELEARAGKVRLVAPGGGTVSQVMVAAGAEAKPGEPVLKIADKHASAEFKLGGDAGELKQGQQVSVQLANGGLPVNAHVARIENGTAVIELPDDAPVKPGDSLRLVKARVPNVVPVPPAAVVKRDSGDVVFVLSDGVVHERKVTVVDTTADQALVGTGLASGDQVVSANAETLHDGQKASQ